MSLAVSGKRLSDAQASRYGIDNIYKYYDFVVVSTNKIDTC